MTCHVMTRDYMVAIEIVHSSNILIYSLCAMAVVFQPPSLPPHSPQFYGVISDGIKVNNKMRRTAGGLAAGRVCIGRSDRGAMSITL